MDPIEKKRRAQQLADESTLSPRKVLQLHENAERNIDAVFRKKKCALNDGLKDSLRGHLLCSLLLWHLNPVRANPNQKVTHLSSW
jgi:hypothetical protein